MTQRIAFVVALVGAVACSKAKKSEPEPEPPPSPSPSPEAARPKAPAAPAFVLATDGGVFALDSTGTATYQYSETQASVPRFIPGTKEILFFKEDQRELVRLSLETGEEKVVAAIPEPKDCGAEQGLSVQADWDFAVDASGERACARLYDRNENMANVSVVARVDLRTGKVESAVGLGIDCPTDEKAEALFDCKPAPAAAIEPSALSREEVDAKLLPAGFEAELRSPSGRWAVLAGEPEEGDYIHRAILMLDTKSGEVFALAEGKWPEPLAKQAMEAGEYQTADAVGESTIEWIGKGEDLLHLDRLLVRPGVVVVAIDGDLAR